MNNNAELKDMTEQAMQRSNVYGFLATVYRKEVTQELLGQIKDPGFMEALSDLAIKIDEKFLSGPEEELLEILAIEYTRLFLGPGKHISPHESVQYERDDGDWGSHWGASTVEVKKFAESLGLHYKESDTSIPDHISVELEIMQKVVAKEAEEWSINAGKDALHYLKIEKLFMEDHIMRWIPKFCDKIKAETESSFYREMAELTKIFVELEIKEINKSISGIKDK